MKLVKFRLTVFRLMLAVAGVAIFLYYFVGDLKRSRRDRFLEIADWHARNGAEYRRNADGSAEMVRIADWHGYLFQEYQQAANQPWTTPRPTAPFPPMGWKPPAVGKIVPPGR